MSLVGRAVLVAVPQSAPLVASVSNALSVCLLACLLARLFVLFFCCCDFCVVPPFEGNGPLRASWPVTLRFPFSDVQSGSCKEPCQYLKVVLKTQCPSGFISGQSTREVGSEWANADLALASCCVTGVLRRARNCTSEARQKCCRRRSRGCQVYYKSLRIQRAVYNPSLFVSVGKQTTSAPRARFANRFVQMILDPKPTDSRVVDPVQRVRREASMGQLGLGGSAPNSLKYLLRHCWGCYFALPQNRSPSVDPFLVGVPKG